MSAFGGKADILFALQMSALIRANGAAIILHAEGVTLNRFVAIASSLVTVVRGHGPSEELDPLATRDRHLPSI